MSLMDKAKFIDFPSIILIAAAILVPAIVGLAL
jgi:hypothetical protein